MFFLWSPQALPCCSGSAKNLCSPPASKGRVPKKTEESVTFSALLKKPL